MASGWANDDAVNEQINNTIEDAVARARGLLFARLYRRASAEQAFVRTGLGGQKVVMSGGAIVMPIFHKIIP
ncbi:hypothetical protein MJI37_30645, partial [Salmonella enterica subsp. enterica serovar Cerro]|nr:hypothetical protein [Salmonella enterica subsp. enterica serovar Cerro]